jgi:hypothetical protein
MIRGRGIKADNLAADTGKERKGGSFPFMP